MLAKRRPHLAKKRPHLAKKTPSATHRSDRCSKKDWTLRLTELIKSTYGDIFPPKVFLAQSNAPRLGCILKR